MPQTTSHQGSLNGVPTFDIELSVRKTAEALDLCEKTVQRLIDRRLLRPSTALRHFLIPRSEIIRFLEQTSQSDHEPLGVTGTASLAPAP